MSVVVGREETGTGKAWVALVSYVLYVDFQQLTFKVNTDASDIALSATDYSPVELSYIKAVVSSPGLVV